MQPAITAMSRQLGALKAILQKAEDHCAARKIEPSVLLNDRLAADMLPFVAQVRIACDHAKGAAYRLAGLEVLRVEDTETSFAELRDRIDRTLALVAEDGAKVRDSLTARAASMRHRELADAEAKAEARSQSMLVAQLVMCAGFLVFLVYPALARVVG